MSPDGQQRAAVLTVDQHAPLAGTGVALVALTVSTLPDLYSLVGLTELAVALAAIGVAGLLIWRGERFDLDATERVVAWAAAAYLATLAAGLFYADEPAEVVEVFRDRSTAATLAVLGFVLVRLHGRLLPGARGLAFGALALGGLGSLDAIGVDAGRWTLVFDDRLAGVYLDPNFLAQALAAGLACCFTIVTLDRGPFRIVGLAGLAACAISLTLTESRGGYLAAAVGLLTVAAIGRGKVVRVLAVVTLIGGLVLVGMGTIGERFGELKEAAGEANLEEADPSAAGRLRHLYVGYEMLLDHPTLGLGAGNYKEHYREYSRELDEADARRPGRSAHSLPIETVAEQGLVGATVFGILLLVPIVSTARSVRRNEWSQESMAAVAVIAALCAWLTAALFLHQGRPKVLWLLLGLVLGARRCVERGRSE